MLLRFSAENFRSIEEGVELNLTSSRQASSDLFRCDRLSLNILPVAGIYGGNATGKSNVLRSLAHMASFVNHSHRSWAPDASVQVEPFAYSAHPEEQRSIFEVDLLIHDEANPEVRYTYGFEASKKRFHREWLYAYFTARRSLLFERTGDSIKTGPSLKGNHRAIAKLVRPNSLFLSAAAQNAYVPLAPVYDWFSKALLFVTPAGLRGRGLTTVMVQDERFQPKILELLQRADLNIEGVKVSEEEIPEELASAAAALVKAAGGIGDPVTKADRIEFEHVAGQRTATLPFYEESAGTQLWYEALGPIVRALRRGSVLCFDDMDASLHPSLIADIVTLFRDSESNPRGAQLLFNGHAVTLLGRDTGPAKLERDEIWFTERGNNGATRLIPLLEYKPRKDENLLRSYLQGKYGGVPSVALVGFSPGDDAESS